jgi:hypothetical protein
MDSDKDIVRPARFENTSVTLSGTGTALGSVSGLARWGLPIDELVLTKSAGVAQMDVVLCVSNAGKVYLSVDEASSETLAITAKKGAVTLQGNPLAKKCVDGTYAPASALVDGAYILEF